MGAGSEQMRTINGRMLNARCLSPFLDRLEVVQVTLPSILASDASGDNPIRFVVPASAGKRRSPEGATRAFGGDDLLDGYGPCGYHDGR